MEIMVLHVKNPLPVTMMHLHGELNGSDDNSFQEQAREEFRQGARDLLLELSFLTRLSPAGLAGLQAVVALYNDGDPAGTEENQDNHFYPHVKLLNVPEKIKEVLDQTGETAHFEIYTDLQRALDSFL
jgi:anti-anti-sigma regulatory factor